MFEFKTGSALPNGATVLRAVRGHDRVIVLALAGDEFVTWHANDDGETFWGEYYAGSLTAAVQGLSDRCAERWSTMPEVISDVA